MSDERIAQLEQRLATAEARIAALEAFGNSLTPRLAEALQKAADEAAHKAIVELLSYQQQATAAGMLQ